MKKAKEYTLKNFIMNTKVCPKRHLIVITVHMRHFEERSDEAIP